MATLTGILGGFAFAAVLQLVSNENESKLYTATIITFSLSTVMLLYSLIVFVLLFAAAAELNIVPIDLDGLGTSALIVVVGAVLIFLVGIAMTGWIRSKTAGIITTALAIITTCMVLIALFNVASIFT